MTINEPEKQPSSTNSTLATISLLELLFYGLEFLLYIVAAIL